MVERKFQAVRVDGGSLKPRRVSAPTTAEAARAEVDRRIALGRRPVGSSTWYEVRPASGE